MVDSKEDNNEVCGYCDKNVVKKSIKCSKCDQIYHTSCGVRVNCCGSKLIQQNTTDTSDLNTEDERERIITNLSAQNEELLQENNQLRHQNSEQSKEIAQLNTEIKKLQEQNKTNINESQVSSVKVQEKQLNTKIQEFIALTIDKEMLFYREDINLIKQKLNKLGKASESASSQKNILVEKSDLNDRSLSLPQKVQYNTAVIKDLVSLKHKIPQQKLASPKNNIPVTAKQSEQQKQLNNLESTQKQIMDHIINLDQATSSSIIQPAPERSNQNRDVGNSNQTINIKNDGEFIFPRNKRGQRQKTIIGQNETTTKLRAVEPLSWIFISRLEPETTVEDITSYLNDYDIKISKCMKLKTYSEEISAFKIAVTQSDEDLVFSSNIWPKKTIIRPYDPNRLRNFQRSPPASLKN